MGASGWDARVSYRDDIEAALQEARWDVFRRKDFFTMPTDDKARSTTEEEYVAWGVEQTRMHVPDDPETWAAGGEAYRDEWRAAQVVVTDPDSLLRAQPFSLTHSVIDMTHVADEPEYAAVAPASAEELVDLFGTTQPSVAAIEAAIDSGVIEGFGRGHGVYLIGYADGRPDVIFFVGYSGD